MPMHVIYIHVHRNDQAIVDLNPSCRPIYALINLHGQICIAIIVVVVCVYIYMYWLICIVLSDRYMFRGSLSDPGPGENTCKRGKKRIIALRY